MARLACVLFAICLIIPLISSQCSIDTAKVSLRKAVYDFSMKLVKSIVADQDYHFVTSALSPWALISTISLGATDGTLQEIIDVLRLHKHKCFNSKYYEIIKELTAATDNTVLERSSNLFVDNRMPLKEDFSEKIKKYNVSAVENLQFDNSDVAAAIINDYVSKATRGTIKDIVTPDALNDVYLVLIDAIYFKGTWTDQFNAELTYVSPFYDENEEKIGDVKMMPATRGVKLAQIDQIGSEVLELTYGSQDRFSMLFVLPKRGVPLSRVVEKLCNISLKTIFSSLRGPAQVQIRVPRFKISSDVSNMKKYLEEMGLKSMFDSNSARLEGISQYSLYISDVIQKADVEVTEQGTVASTATALFAIPRSFQPLEEFTLNRPFLFMIVDKHTEIALFTGAYSKPTMFN